MNGLLRDELNCYFLLELAHEYQIESNVEKCQSFMFFMVKEKIENDVLTMLMYGQNYHFKALTSACIDEVRHLSLKEWNSKKKRSSQITTCRLLRELFSDSRHNVRWKRESEMSGSFMWKPLQACSSETTYTSHAKHHWRVVRLFSEQHH